MEKLSIFYIENVSTKEYNAVSVKLFPGEDIEDAVIGFNRVVFENNQGLLYARLAKKLGDNTEWECDEGFDDCIRVTGDAKRVAIRRHYRFERNNKGQLVKANPERIVSFVKVVAFKGGSIEEEVARYLSQIPDNLFLDDEEEE